MENQIMTSHLKIMHCQLVFWQVPQGFFSQDCRLFLHSKFFPQKPMYVCDSIQGALFLAIITSLSIFSIRMLRLWINPLSLKTVAFTQTLTSCVRFLTSMLRSLNPLSYLHHFQCYNTNLRINIKCILHTHVQVCCTPYR